MPIRLKRVSTDASANAATVAAAFICFPAATGIAGTPHPEGGWFTNDAHGGGAREENRVKLAEPANQPINQPANQPTNQTTQQTNPPKMKSTKTNI